jgi:crotonobetainyl-CoA:carnitine CoA-transferase CaiB-like acyl-CoA transferase
MSEAVWKDYVKKKAGGPKPLKGLRVLEICTLVFGPSGPSWLAEMGAETIKCEIPPLGDVERALSCAGFLFKEQSPLFLHDNVNKLYLGLDLHIPEAQEIFKELALKADIIEDNLRPGVMERWNVGYRQIREIHPRIIYVEKNGFGQWGPYAEESRPSNDGAAQAFSGLSWMSSFPGRPPVKQMIYICDMYGALMTEVAVLSALHYRDRTGKGQYIEASQTETIMRGMSWIWPYQFLTKKEARPAGNRDVSICPADTFQTSDGTLIAMAAATPEEFEGLCRAMGKPEMARDPRFKDHSVRLKEENATALLKIIADWTKTKTAKDIESLAEKHHFAASKVMNAKDICESTHLRERGFMTPVDDALYGEYVDHEFPVMMSKTPPKKKWSARPVGFDNEYILESILGKKAAEIRNLYECKAVGKWADRAGRRPPPGWDGKSGINDLLSR